MTDVEIVRKALPGDRGGDAHLALDRIELALKLITQEAKDGLLEVQQGVENAPTFWLQAIEQRARSVVVDRPRRLDPHGDQS